MDRAFEAPMTIRVILPEDSDATKPTRPSTVRYCGEAVSGYLEVATDGEYMFEIDVAFEGCSEICCSFCSIFTKSQLGVVRTWLGPNSDNDSGGLPQTAEVQASRLLPFLSMSE